ncbi:MAG: YbaK/EbsC family protein, partial [Pseudomonadales bacterium]|nr:YbaK/EbsC family protein [Pseudomonadales bacterium]
MSVSDVEAALAAAGIETTITLFSESTATSAEAAEQIGCELGQIAKSLAFLIDGEPIVVLASGDVMIDDRKLASHFGVGRKKVKAAKPEQLLEIYGYVPGAMPPLGHRTAGLRTFLDTSLQRFDQLYASGGAVNAIFPVSLPTLQAATGGQFESFAR